MTSVRITGVGELQRALASLRADVVSLPAAWGGIAESAARSTRATVPRLTGALARSVAPERLAFGAGVSAGRGLAYGFRAWSALGRALDVAAHTAPRTLEVAVKRAVARRGLQ